MVCSKRSNFSSEAISVCTKFCNDSFYLEAKRIILREANVTLTQAVVRFVFTLELQQLIISCRVQFIVGLVPPFSCKASELH